MRAAWCETNTERTDLQAVISVDGGAIQSPVAVPAFNLNERWANDVSEDIAHEIRRRAGPAYDDLLPSVEDLLSAMQVLSAS